MNRSNEFKNLRESCYAFLERSKDSTNQRIFDFLQDCLSLYHQHHRQELLSRLKSNNCFDFLSAVTELLIFTIFVRLGCRVCIHPTIETKGTHPDFYITQPNGQSFYLEIITICTNDGNNIGGKKNFERLLEGLNQKVHPKFGIFIDDVEYPSQGQRNRKVIDDICTWLDSLSWEDAMHIVEEHESDTLPQKTFKYPGLTLNITAFPKSLSHQDKKHPLLLCYNEIPKYNIISHIIKKKIKSKIKKYGPLRYPLVTAINDLTFSISMETEVEILFGQESYIININSPTKINRFTRKPDGIWSNSKKISPYFSGVWFFNNLHLKNLQNCETRLYVNPYYTDTFPSILWSLPYIIVKDNYLNERSGITIAKILQLPQNWPFDD